MFQYLANGIVLGAQIGILALGFGLIYRTSRILHFAHAAIFLIGAYGALFVFRAGGNDFFFVAICAGIVLGAIIGLAIEILLYAPLRRLGSSGLQIFVASLGVYLVVLNGIALSFGNDPFSFFPGVASRVITVIGARVTLIQLLTLFCFFACILLQFFLIARTRIGMQLRAVMDNPPLAESVGLPVGALYLTVMVIGSCYAALAGILMAWDTTLSPSMAMNPLMLAIIAVIIGGSSIFGPAIGALLLGIVLHLSTVWIPASWQEAVAFVMLLVFLAFRQKLILFKGETPP